MSNKPTLYKVKIIKASLPTFWYANYIGVIFDVYDNIHDKNYVIKEDYDRQDGDPRRIIDKIDCEIINYDLLLKKFNFVISKLNKWAGSVTTVYPEDIQNLLENIKEIE